MQRYPYLIPDESIYEQFRSLREIANVSILHVAEKSGFSQSTVEAIEDSADAQLSTLLRIFDFLGYNLYPVPKTIAEEVATFIANGGIVIVKPAGDEAPMNERLAQFRRRVQELGDSGDMDDEVW